MKDEIILPTQNDAKAALDAALAPAHERVRNAMRGLAHSPPQVLVLEGGLEPERFSMALWYAALLNCRDENGTCPCLACPSCLQTGAQVHVDLHIIDGREESIKIETVRELRQTLGEAPHGGGTRVVIFAEAQALSTQAANALLKSLEEPKPGNVFLLLAPQRERLLPTLVSRGWALTLAWPPTRHMSAEAREWAKRLALFLRTGQSWFELTATKGSVDAASARKIILTLQKALAAASAGCSEGELGTIIDRLPPANRLTLNEILAHAQQSLEYAVNPGLVLDWMATRLFLLVQLGSIPRPGHC